MISLRPPTDADWPFIHALWNNPKVAAWSDAAGNPKTYSMEDVQAIYGSINKTGSIFIVDVDGRPAGESWLQRMNVQRVLDRFPGRDVRRIDLAIAEESLWGAGIGTAVIKELTDLGLGKDRADAIYCPEIGANPRSVRAFQKAGYIITNGSTNDLALSRTSFDRRKADGDNLEILLAGPSHLGTVVDVLAEASAWLKGRGIEQWVISSAEVLRPRVAPMIERDEMHLVRRNGVLVGVFQLIWSDPAYWGPRPDDAAYLHRFAIRRAFGGQHLGRRILARIDEMAAYRDRSFLRLDCMARNPGLNAYYQGNGFTPCGEAIVDGYRARLHERPVQVGLGIR